MVDLIQIVFGLVVPLGVPLIIILLVRKMHIYNERGGKEDKLKVRDQYDLREIADGMVPNPRGRYTPLMATFNLGSSDWRAEAEQYKKELQEIKKRLQGPTLPKKPAGVY